MEGLDSRDVVHQALAAGLNVIAVTDHNSIEWCEGVIEAAAGTALSVLPGVEISTSEGHLLAIFDVATSDAKCPRSAGTGRNQRGGLWQPRRLVRSGLDKLAEQVEKAGGLAIAAHVDAPKGFWTLTAATGVRRTTGCTPLRRSLPSNSTTRN